jgi:hypothetical protein
MGSGLTPVPRNAIPNVWFSLVPKGWIGGGGLSASRRLTMPPRLPTPRARQEKSEGTYQATTLRSSQESKPPTTAKTFARLVNSASFNGFPCARELSQS